MKNIFSRIPSWIILLTFACLGLFALALSFIPRAQAGVPTSGEHAPSGGVPDIALASFATGLDSPVEITNAGDTRLFVVEQTGRIRIVQSDGTLLGTSFMDITDRVYDIGDEQGLLGLAFHPDYVNNGYFYVNYTRDAPGTSDDGDTVISRFSVTGDPNVADPNSELILMVVNQPYSNHNGGDLNFGPDGYLYIGMGDGGSGGDPENRAQNGLELLGKMLRIDVDGGGQAPDCYASGPYTIPADNPFIGVSNTCDEIWAFGVRNPWRFSFDSLTGDIFIADVGQNTWEEVNFQPASGGGENWGWRCYEGNHPYNTSGCGPIGNYDFPFTEYQHGINCSITGGFVYRGSQYPVFYGHYIFADYCSGQTWTAINEGSWVVTAQGDLGSLFTTFGEGADGEIYLASRNGQIYHVIENSPLPTASPTITLTPTHTPTSTQTPTNTPTPTPTLPINLIPVATGFVEPVDVANAGDERLFVAERVGLVYEVSGDGTVIPEPLLVITDRVGMAYYEQGLLSIAFDPDFANNGFLYTQYTGLNGDIIISRFTHSGTFTSSIPLQPIDPATELEILTIDHPNTFDNDNGGELVFGPDGYLYISVGDGGVPDNAQDLQTLLGKVLRIDVHMPGENGLPYTIPPDNPYVSDPNALDEIWASGFRNPWRFSFDSLTGDLYLGDVGEWLVEEIDFQEAGSLGGENYGWSCYEGSVESPYYTSTLCTEAYTFSIHEYDHSVGHVVVGGHVYRGCNYSDMYGKYYFADYVFGNLWSLEEVQGNWNVEPLLTFAGSFSSFGEGFDGELYLLDLGGTLYHLAGNQLGTCHEFPYQIWFPSVLNP